MRVDLRRILAFALALVASTAGAAQLKIADPETLPGGDGGTADNFGYSVAIEGDTLVVGAPNDNVNGHDYHGSVSVFVRSGGVWNLQQKLVPTDGNVPFQLGGAVAISGDTIVAGASQDAAGGVANAGAAYVFVRASGVWTEQAKLVSDMPQTSSFFGQAVAISGDTIAVGAFFEDVGFNTDNGAVYLYDRDGATWTQHLRLYVVPAHRACGIAVALQADTLLMGCSADKVGTLDAKGTVQVFRRHPVSGWGFEQELTASDGIDYDQFGAALALDGDTAIIGNASYSFPSAYLFQRSGTTWTQGQRVRGAVADQLGQSVAISGDLVAVGARLADVSGNADQGAVQVYQKIGMNLYPTQTVLASDGAADDDFGFGVALSGSDLVSGAPYDHADPMTGDISGPGAIYLDRALGDPVYGDGFE